MLAAVHRALKPGGVFLAADVAGSSNLEENFDTLLAPFAFTVSYPHCMTVSLSEGGEGLGTMWGEQQALEPIREAGFAEVEVKQVPGDIFNNYYVTRK